MRFDIVKTEAPPVPEILHITMVVKHSPEVFVQLFYTTSFLYRHLTVRLAGVADKAVPQERCQGGKPIFLSCKCPGTKSKKSERTKKTTQ